MARSGTKPAISGTNKDKFLLLPLFDTVVSPETTGFYRYNIKDPYGKSPDEFQDCFKRIQRCIEKMFSEIEKRQSYQSVK